MDRIVALLDFADLLRPLVENAMKLARGLHAELILLHASTPDADSEGRLTRRAPTRAAISREMHHYHRELELLQTECRAAGINATALLVRSNSIRGNPARKLVEELDRLRPTLIVIGKHRDGILHGLLLGNVRERIMRRAACPVLVVPLKFAKKRLEI